MDKVELSPPQRELEIMRPRPAGFRTGHHWLALIHPGAMAWGDVGCSSTSYTMIGVCTFFNACSPRARRCRSLPKRRTVSGPTYMAPCVARAARRAARLVTGPEAVKVQRVPVALWNRVAPTAARPELIPMFTA